VHFSATSHTPLAARQTTVFAMNVSVGHAGDVPVHDSATSQLPADARHVVPPDTSVSLGHAGPDPVQVSATSQLPAEARHTTVEIWNESAGHAVSVPLHVSATSQTPTDARHTVADVARTSGQPALTPSHLSSISHAPADARQTVFAAFFVYTQTLFVHEPGPVSHAPGALQSACVVHIMGASGGASAVESTAASFATGASAPDCVNFVGSTLQPTTSARTRVAMIVVVRIRTSPSRRAPLFQNPHAA
jgi:hypothetical protein